MTMFEQPEIDWTEVTLTDALLTTVRQFAVGLEDGPAPSPETVADAEAMCRAAYRYAVTPELYCMDDGALGYIMFLPNDDLVLAFLGVDGQWSWGHDEGPLDEDAPDDEPDDGTGGPTPTVYAEIVAALRRGGAVEVAHGVLR